MVKSYGPNLSRLKRIKHLPKHILEQIYYKSITVNMMHCITVWGARSPSLFFDLGQIHIWAAKLIHNIKDEELSNEQILKRVNWRNLDYIYKHRILLIMHDIYHEKMPKCLTDIFQREEHSGTRQQLNFTIIRPKTEQGRTLLVVLENEILPDDNRS